MKNSLQMIKNSLQMIKYPLWNIKTSPQIIAGGVQLYWPPLDFTGELCSIVSFFVMWKLGG
jgi:hypothetical protein